MSERFEPKYFEKDGLHTVIVDEGAQKVEVSYTLRRGVFDGMGDTIATESFGVRTQPPIELGAAVWERLIEESDEASWPPYSRGDGAIIQTPKWRFDMVAAFDNHGSMPKPKSPEEAKQFAVNLSQAIAKLVNRLDHGDTSDFV